MSDEKQQQSTKAAPTPAVTPDAIMVEIKALRTLVETRGAGSSSSAAQPDPAILAAIAELKAGMEKLWERVGEVRAAQTPEHVPGYCGDEACEVCVPQLRQVAQAAQERARTEMAQEIDEGLVLVGGEQLRERVSAVIVQGEALRVRGARATGVTA